MTTTELPGRVDLSEHGITRPAPSIETRRRRCSTRTRSGAARGGSPRAGRSPSTPARSPAARRRTSSSSRSPARRTGSGGATSTSRSREEHFDGLRDKVTAHLGAADDALRRRRVRRRRPRAPDRRARDHRAPVPRALREDDVHRARTDEELAGFEPQALVLHTPDVEADPAEDGTRTGTFVVLHPARTELLSAARTTRARSRSRSSRVMNDRLPLEGVFPMHCSANVGDDGRRRGLLRALGHRQDDALRRPRALADRRRRARLGRQRRLQHRGRLLREGDPPLAPRPSRRSTGRRTRSGRSSRTSRSTSTASSTSTTTRRPRTRAPPTSSSRSRTRCPRSGPATRARSIFLTADAFGILPPIAKLTREQALYYFLSGFTAKLAGTEIGVTEPQPTFSTCFGAAVPAAAAGGLRADARREARPRTARTSGSSTRAGRAGRSARAAHADRRDARDAQRRALRRARRRRASAPTRSSASRCRSRAGRRREAARPALDLARPGGVRPQGARAGADVRRQLRQALRRRRRGDSRRRAAAPSARSSRHAAASRSHPTRSRTYAA